MTQINSFIMLGRGIQHDEEVTSLKIQLQMQKSDILGRRGHWKDVTTSWPTGWPQAVRDSSHPFLSFLCSSPYFVCSSPYFVCSVSCPHSLSGLQGCSLEKALCLDPREGVHVRTSLEPPCKHLRFWQQVQRSTGLAPRTSLISTHSCFLNRPPACLEWPASVFCLCLPAFRSPHLFHVLPGKLPRLQTNNYFTYRFSKF